ncbi:type I polyketide synthase [Micromonospora sp. DT48]|uniref:type I polyketide synthase n=1 Tax=Micromonospora sp. DT48 TaxID=3393429 RepID=UPI003CF9A012
MSAPQRTDIAVVGVSCRFPGNVRGPEQFWEFLRTAGDGITEVPPDRWDIDEFYSPESQVPGRISSRWGGYLDRVDVFDHEFFSIAEREAQMMDPQHRIFLESAWEAFQDASVDPTTLAGSRTGIVLAMTGIEYATEVFSDLNRISAYSALGTLPSMAVGRLAYMLDLHGPATVLDAACASGLVAVHRACRDLQTHDADMMVCGAVNLLLGPEASIALSQLNESFVGDGRIKAFDKDADGFVRGEGCGVLVLKRLEDAVRDGDPIRAVIAGSAVNQDGRGAGLTAPNGAAHRDLIRRALDDAGLAPNDIGLIEAHGTGTKLGDPIEAQALTEVFAGDGGPDLLLGSVKSNFGHLETAAGMAGLIKVILAVEKGLVPPTCNFSELNPRIDFSGSPLRVVTQVEQWPDRPAGRVAGVNSFGLNGTNAHVIVREAPPRVRRAPAEQRPVATLVLSAKTPRALTKTARRHQVWLRDDLPLDTQCAAATVGRTHFRHRLAVSGRDVQEVRRALAEYVRGDSPGRLLVGQAAKDPEVAFLFSGAGTYYDGAAAGLLQQVEAFRAAVAEVDAVTRKLAGWSVLEALERPATVDDPNARTEHQTLRLFAIEYALATTWRSWGVEPAALIGHSLGEYVAATFAGVLDLEQGIGLVLERSRLLDGLDAPGVMAGVFAAEAEVTSILRSHPKTADVVISAVNAATQVTLSGDPEGVEQATRMLREAGFEVRPVDANRSGHSPLVEPILAPLRDYCRGLEMAPPAIPLVSNVTGRPMPWDQAPDPDYWCRHTRSPVRFADGVSYLAELGISTFIEVGPGAELLGMALGNFAAGDDVLMVPSLRRRQDDLGAISTALTRLYVRGVNIDWSAFYRGVDHHGVTAPTYPFEPVRCWHGIDSAARRTRTDSVADQVDSPRVDDGPVDVPSGETAAAVFAVTREELASRSPREAKDLLVQQLTAALTTAMGFSNTEIDPDVTLTEQGVDSLMAIELHNAVQGALAVDLTMTDFLRDATVSGLASTILARIEQSRTDEPAQSPIAVIDRRQLMAEQLLSRLSTEENGTSA